MEREGSAHALDEMLNDEAHEEKKPDTMNGQDKDYNDRASRLFSELQKNEQIRQQEIDKNQTALTTGERITITRNKEAQKALREWRRDFKISEYIHGTLNQKHAKEFFTWAQENGKINFSEDKNLEKLYTKYVGELSLPEQTSEEVISVAEEKEESPSVIVDYATHYKIEAGKTLANILKHSKVSKAYEAWVEETGQNKKRQRLSSKEKTQEFINWAIQNKEIDFSKLLKEKEGDSASKFEKNKAETSEYADAGKEKSPEEEPNIIVDPKIYEEAEVEAAKKRIAEIPTEVDTSESEEKTEKLRNLQKQMFDLYGIRLDEDGNAATPKDETKIATLLGLIDADVRKVQRSGFFGKVKGFFQDIGTSEKDKMKASAFKRDLSEYMQVVLEDTKPKYGSRGPVSRSVVRERGSVGTPVGSIETTRHSPIKRAAPKRGRPRKAKV